MEMPLSARTQKLIKDRMKKGGYGSPDEVIVAALSSLQQQQEYGDFEQGELDELLAQGERSGKPLEGKQVFAELRQLRTRKNKAG
jgi:Arc/MetJ-type ribon-helix-helix transcriptional regulator